MLLAPSSALMALRKAVPSVSRFAVPLVPRSTAKETSPPSTLTSEIIPSSVTGLSSSGSFTSARACITASTVNGTGGSGPDLVRGNVGRGSARYGRSGPIRQLRERKAVQRSRFDRRRRGASARCHLLHGEADPFAPEAGGRGLRRRASTSTRKVGASFTMSPPTVELRLKASRMRAWESVKMPAWRP